jgi:hypothetical protein
MTKLDVQADFEGWFIHTLRREVVELGLSLPEIADRLRIPEVGARVLMLQAWDLTKAVRVAEALGVDIMGIFP